MSITGFPANLRRIAARGHDLLFPPLCAGCGRQGAHLCARCAQAVRPPILIRCPDCSRPLAIPNQPCTICRRGPPPPMGLARAAALHEGPMQAAIHRYKYEDHPELADTLARYLVAAFAATDWDGVRQAVDGVVPVPLHLDRLTARGYNQSALLAVEFCRRTGLSLRERWIMRARLTRPQVGLTAAERAENVRAAFVADPALAGRAILLIDDVFTTGATLNACAQAAAAAGACAVFGLTLAMPATK